MVLKEEEEKGYYNLSHGIFPCNSTLGCGPSTAPSSSPRPSVSLAVLEMESHKLALHKHEVSLAFIPVFHLTLTLTHPDSADLILGWGLPGVFPRCFVGRQREVTDIGYKIWARML